MGEIKIKRNQVWTTTKATSIKRSTGWLPGHSVWLRQGSGWTKVPMGDRTPPGPPTFQDMAINNRNRRITLRLRTASDPDINRMVMKYTDQKYPSMPHDGQYNWDGMERDAGPNYDVVWLFSPPKYNTEYFISAWNLDTSGNASTRFRRSFVITPPQGAPPPGTPIVVRKQHFNASDSGSWVTDGGPWGGGTGEGTWEPGTKVVQAGSKHEMGVWLYGTRITSALRNATLIRSMSIRIQRMRHDHGADEAAVYLSTHNLTSKSNNATLHRPIFGPRIGTLQRGQAKTFQIPETMWHGFITGDVRGFMSATRNAGQLHTTRPSDHAEYFGVGTTSGQVYIEWEEPAVGTVDPIMPRPGQPLPVNPDIYDPEPDEM